MIQNRKKGDTMLCEFCKDKDCENGSEEDCIREWEEWLEEVHRDETKGEQDEIHKR